MKGDKFIFIVALVLAILIAYCGYTGTKVVGKREVSPSELKGCEITLLTIHNALGECERELEFCYEKLNK